MIELVSRNVSLKPSQRRQINAWLRRPLRIGQRIGNFVMKLTIQRTGNMYVVRADVQDGAGTFTCRARQASVLDACKRVVHAAYAQLHSQRLQLNAS